MRPAAGARRFFFYVMTKRLPTPDAADAFAKGVWTAADVSALLDVPAMLVKLLPAAFRSAQWCIQGPALFLFWLLDRRWIAP
jgi:hypothetical protein